MIDRLRLHGAAPILPPIAIDRNIARGLVQIRPGLLHLCRIGLKHTHKGVVRQILGLRAIAQATSPGADQLFVMLEKAGSAGTHGGMGVVLRK